MSLERYLLSPPFEDENGAISFGMRDRDLDIIVPCRVSAEAIDFLCGKQGDRARDADFSECRDEIEAMARHVYGRAGQPGIVNLTRADAEKFRAEHSGTGG